MVSVAEKKKVEDQCHATLETLGFPELIPKLTIEWNKRFTQRIGDAVYSPELAEEGELPSPARVRFSVPLWARASEEVRYEFVVHEICHIIVDYQNEGNPPWKWKGCQIQKDFHGEQWQALMRQMGLVPHQYHSVDNSGLRKKSKKVKVYCACQEFLFSKHRATKLRKNPGLYYCKRCRTPIRLQENKD